MRQRRRAERRLSIQAVSEGVRALSELRASRSGCEPFKAARSATCRSRIREHYPNSRETGFQTLFTSGTWQKFSWKTGFQTLFTSGILGSKPALDQKFTGILGSKPGYIRDPGFQTWFTSGTLGSKPGLNQGSWVPNLVYIRKLGSKSRPNLAKPGQT